MGLEDTVDIVAFALIALVVAYIVYEISSAAGWFTNNANNASTTSLFCQLSFLWGGGGC